MDMYTDYLRPVYIHYRHMCVSSVCEREKSPQKSNIFFSEISRKIVKSVVAVCTNAC